jgi:hypothetical protein
VISVKEAGSGLILIKVHYHHVQSICFLPQSPPRPMRRNDQQWRIQSNEISLL